MSGLRFVILGGVAMVAGVLLLYAWMNNKSRWLDSENFEQHTSGRMGCLFWSLYLLYFVALVITPLLGGALMIVYGLEDW
jgi:accessory gene regulator protein AgrB